MSGPNKFSFAFHVGSRLFDWLFWSPLTREREMPTLLWIKLLLFTLKLDESTVAEVWLASISVTASDYGRTSRLLTGDLLLFEVVGPMLVFRELF